MSLSTPTACVRPWKPAQEGQCSFGEALEGKIAKGDEQDGKQGDIKEVTQFGVSKSEQDFHRQVLVELFRL